MIERVNESNLQEYENFIKSHPKGLFQHSSKWAKVKSAWKWEAVMLNQGRGGCSYPFNPCYKKFAYVRLPRLYRRRKRF